MNISVVSSPHILTAEKNGAASLHIGHILGILREECPGTDVFYYDHNNSLFYLFAKVVNEFINNEITLPKYLHYEEKKNIIIRMVFEDYFDIDIKLRLSTIFNINTEIIKKLTRILILSLEHFAEDILKNSPNFILLFISPDISYSLILGSIIKKKNHNVSLVFCDRYTYEPATPYLYAPLMKTDIYKNDISWFLKCDYMITKIASVINNIVSIVIIDEGYDVIRMIFGSKKVEYPIKTEVYMANGSIKETIFTMDNSNIIEDRVMFMFSKHVDLDSLPMPDFTEMKQIYASAEFELTRGCSYNCMFCERSAFFGNDLRSHSLEYMKDLINHILKDKFEFYTLIDAALNIDETKAITFLQMLEDEKISFPYQANLRVKIPNKKLLRLMHITGCIEIAIGVETADNALLKSMKKIQDITMLNSLFTAINEYKIPLMLFLIIGFPTESLASVIQTINLITEVNNTNRIDIVEIEYYHPGHIQALRPSRFCEYGIEWMSPQNISDIRNATYMFVEPGIYGAAQYRQGMTRKELQYASDNYIKKLGASGINYLIDHKPRRII